MSRRVLALAAAVSVSALAGLAGAPAAQAKVAPSIQLSTTNLVPGQTVVISGTGWPVLTSVVATLCGADAVSGTSDCAVTETATMVATHHGLLYSRFPVVVPPAPCPCVMLITSVTSNFTEMIPVTVFGQRSAPVRRLPPSPFDKPRITRLAVSASTSVGSVFGAPAPRTLTVGLDNSGRTTVAPVLVGRWGRSGDATTVIKMPKLRPLKPGQRVTVAVPFDLGALAVGTYEVHVEVQLVGLPTSLSETTTTSQWPIALFIAVGLLVLWLVVGIVRRRRRREDEATPNASGLAALPVKEAPAAAAGAKAGAQALLANGAEREGDGAEDQVAAPADRVGSD